MDFFAQQDHARRKTKRLILLFALAVISIVLMIYLLVVGFGYWLGLQHVSRVTQLGLGEPVFSWWNPKLLLLVTLGTVTVIFLGSAWKTMALSAGGSAVATSLGGRLVNPLSTQPDERKLLNIVEEMSIASGVPMPQVYVLDEEPGINAFAAGFTTSDAAVAVTRSCLTQLTRDELQGVIGHEFSHILNGDMRLNIRLMGILFGIFCIATIGRILLRARSSGRDKNPLPLIGIALLIVGSLGLFFGRLIQAAVSRQREFLADASAVQFTRNPSGLSHALQKLGSVGSEVNSPNAPDASHLFFANALSSPLVNLMATHPPLEQRIRAIDPNWDGRFRPLSDNRVEQLFERAKPKSAAPPMLDPKMAAVILSAGSEPSSPLRATQVLPNLGNPTPLHLEYAEAMRDSFSENLRAAARSPLDATALIYALLLANDPALRMAQLTELSNRVSASIAEKTADLFPEVSQAAKRARLPIVNLAISGLRALNPLQFQQFAAMLEWFIASDRRVELFEFVLQKIVRRHLAPQFAGSRPVRVEFYTIKPLIPDCALILSALANVGAGDPEKIQQAFAHGAPFLRAPQNAGLELLPRERCGVNQVGAALDRLAQAAPIIKKNLLEACARVVGADGLIRETEAELLRAVADTLDCPIPPLGVAE